MLRQHIWRNKTILLAMALISIWGFLVLPGCSSKGTSDTAVKNLAYAASQEDIKAGNKTVADTSSAIQARDVKAFTSLMSKNVLNHVQGSPDLTCPAASTLADSLRNAKIVKAEKDAFTYEITINAARITFMVIKEDGTWKISGL